MTLPAARATRTRRTRPPRPGRVEPARPPHAERRPRVETAVERPAKRRATGRVARRARRGSRRRRDVARSRSATAVAARWWRWSAGPDGCAVALVIDGDSRDRTTLHGMRPSASEPSRASAKSPDATSRRNAVVRRLKTSSRKAARRDERIAAERRGFARMVSTSGRALTGSLPRRTRAMFPYRGGDRAPRSTAANRHVASRRARASATWPRPRRRSLARPLSRARRDRVNARRRRGGAPATTSALTWRIFRPGERGALGRRAPRDGEGEGRLVACTYASSSPFVGSASPSEAGTRRSQANPIFEPSTPTRFMYWRPSCTWLSQFFPARRLRWSERFDVDGANEVATERPG